jgi:hypothetical protein
MYFDTKNYLKSNRNHTIKHILYKFLSKFTQKTQKGNLPSIL